MNFYRFSIPTWNIGFLQCTPKDLIENKGLGKVIWLKHPYRDRFFADPFILSVKNNRIVVLVEELKFDVDKGTIVELVVDLKSKELIERRPLLDLDTHLSYPAIIVIDGHTYVYPENGDSGKLSLYEYDYVGRELRYVGVMVEEALIDSTIYMYKGRYFLYATKKPDTQENVFLYSADNFKCGYVEYGCISEGKQQSRPAGNLFSVDGKLYRPAQNCVNIYGGGIEIMEIVSIEGTYMEKHLFSIKPESFNYNLGIHTINFHNDLCVVDGKGYLYPVVGRLYNRFRHLYYLLKNRK